MKRFSLCILFSLSLSVNGATVLVRSGSFFFNPTNVVINPGDRVVWTNTTVQTHDSESTASPPLWSSPDLGLGATFGFTFTNLGYYPYRCDQHRLTFPNQTGTVSVVSISLTNASRTPANAQFEIRGGRTGLRAVVEAGNDLSSATAIRTNTFPANGTISFTDTNPPPARRFYRARVIP